MQLDKIGVAVFRRPMLFPMTFVDVATMLEGSVVTKPIKVEIEVKVIGGLIATGVTGLVTPLGPAAVLAKDGLLASDSVS